MKTKLFVGQCWDMDVGMFMMCETQVKCVQKVVSGWYLESIDGCAYDLEELQVIEGDFILRDPKPTDSKT